jgi:hypothetical protein
MNIQLIPAARLTEKRKAKERAKMEALEKVVETFINSEVTPAIMKAQGTSVNVKAPYEADINSDDFFALCAEILEPLGYDSAKSHDGGGIYTTLCVQWS